jgi:hypothetical protein
MCINPDHLFLGTIKDNTHDAINKGRFYQVFKKGHQPKNSTIKDAGTIREIKRLIAGGPYLTSKKIAKLFNVSIQLIKDIKGGRSYVNISI